jgi:hypothetical protein
MSGVTGAIAALAFGPRKRPASRIEKTKAISAWGPVEESTGQPGMPPNSDSNSHSKLLHHSHNIFFGWPRGVAVRLIPRNRREQAAARSHHGLIFHRPWRVEIQCR